PTEERRVAQHVRDEDTIAIRVLEVEELEAVGEVCGDRLLEEHVVAVSSDGTTHIEVRRVGRADEDDIGEPGDREQLVDVGKSTLRRDPVPALELRAPRRIRLDHTAEGEAGVVRRDQLGEDAVPPRARTDDDNVPHPGSDIISTGSAPGSPARISRTARVPRRVDQTATPPTAISREPRAVRPKIRWPPPKVSPNTATFPMTHAPASRPIARRGAVPPISPHHPGGRTRATKRSRCSRGTGGVRNVATSEATVARATITTNRYSSRTSGKAEYSTNAATVATVIPAISVHAFTRHQTQRSIAGSPSPAPRATKNFHAPSMLEMRLAMTTASREMRTTVTRLTATSSRWEAWGRR